MFNEPVGVGTGIFNLFVTVLTTSSQFTKGALRYLSHHRGVVSAFRKVGFNYAFIDGILYALILVGSLDTLDSFSQAFDSISIFRDGFR